MVSATKRKARRGADYCADAHADPVFYPARWWRMTSSGWQAIKEPKRYMPQHALNQMYLCLCNDSVWLVRDHALPERTTSKPVTILERGTLAELWETFLTHGRMVLSK